MDNAFWLEAWSEGRTGFHQPEGHPLLPRCWPMLPGRATRVLVPLCGKTPDMQWLADQGHEVVGFELSEAAVAAFFDAHDQRPHITRHGRCKRYAGDRITLYAGDFFAPWPDDLAPFDAFYDRAALVALPSDRRARYVERIVSALTPDAVGLLVSFTYDPMAMQGPPFSIDADEIDRLFADFRLSQLADIDALGDTGSLAGASLPAARETVYGLMPTPGTNASAPDERSD